jgi:hypothetical protein
VREHTYVREREREREANEIPGGIEREEKEQRTSSRIHLLGNLQGTSGIQNQFRNEKQKQMDGKI